MSRKTQLLLFLLVFLQMFISQVAARTTVQTKSTFKTKKAVFKTKKTKVVTYKGKTAAQWMKLLGAKTEQHRFEGVYALSQMGKHAHIAVPELIKALKDKSEAIRKTAVLALGEVG